MYNKMKLIPASKAILTFTLNSKIKYENKIIEIAKKYNIKLVFLCPQPKPNKAWCMCPLPGDKGCLPFIILATNTLSESNNGIARITMANNGPLFGNK